MNHLLDTFRAAGVLSAADVHIARALCRLGGDPTPEVMLAVALAARAPRHGHVAVDLATVAETAPGELEDEPAAEFDPGAVTRALAQLPWPNARTWAPAVQRSVLVGTVDGPGELPDAERPLVWSGGLLYLQRYWAYERVVADQLIERAAGTPMSEGGPDGHTQADLGAARSIAVAEQLLTGEGAEQQLAAVRTALQRRLSVLVGGPGTGKTTTVAALLAVLLEQAPADGSGTIEVALAAPTGKAAARLGEAFRDAAARLPQHLGERLAATEASTIHRLLGVTRAPGSGFRHHRSSPLHHDVVIVDESSMISLPLMARLLDAVRPDARLVVVGDPGQLASVDAGSVLADVVGPLGEHRADAPQRALADSVTVLRYSRRFPPASPLDRLARAINVGDHAAAIEVLADPASSDASAGALSWIPAAADRAETIEQVRGLVLPAVLEVVEAAASGSAEQALAALERVRVLCAHRLGPFGVGGWNRRIEDWLAQAGHAVGGWYVGRPVMITANDYRLDLFNGDLGVTTAGPPTTVAFPAPGGVRGVAPSRLDHAETVHAMTIHKSQGSEFDHVVVVLPSADSRLVSRELLYTAVTRARTRVTVVGDTDVVTAAISRRIVRSSGLRSALWAR